VPVGIVGCEETMPAIANIKPLARALGIPYAPIVPSLLPLPARVYLNFGKPMHFSCCVNEAEVTERVDEVKAELRQLIEKGLQERTSIY
jgi:hypothetical protein